mgnify:CR=1 FL=1
MGMLSLRQTIADVPIGRTRTIAPTRWMADATDSVIGEYLSIGPVIYVDQGARVTVMVDRDLEIF